MSMTSSLIDELNKSADEWSNSNMFELARMCREAADTITELRGALQVASVDYRHLSEENAKLRELCRRALVVLENNCSQCVYFYECDIVNDCNCVAPTHIRNELRELGIEVE